MTCIVLYKLYLQRVVLLHESFIEGMCSIDGFSPPSGFSTEVNINNLSSQCEQNMLKDCVIKASHNSASNGTNIDTNMVSFVISRGVRFLDFELHYDGTDGVIVGQDSGNNNVKFSDILTKINESAFTSYSGCESPNKNDPMFIHLRIKTGTSAAYTAINADLNSFLQNNSPRKTDINVYPDTKLSEILKKYVIIVDQNSENYFDNPSIISKNAVSGDGYFKLFNGSGDVIQCPKRPTLTSDTTTDITAVNILLEQATYSIFGYTITDPSMKDLVTTYGMQVIAYKYYGTNTTNRDQSEAVFNYFNSAFINLAQCIQYFEALETQ
jgi:hypothetical protein